MTNDPQPPPSPPLRGDEPYTIRITILCLLIGVPIAAAAGLLLYSLSKPLTPVNGQVTLAFSSFAFPLALLVSGAVLAWSVFILPVTFARRAERVLDPRLWPMMGVLSLAGLLVVAFVAAILLNII